MATAESNDTYLEFLRVPQALWLPTPFAYDTFTRADGALGSTETTGIDGQAAPTLSWSTIFGTCQVVSNQIKATALDGSGRGAAIVSPSSADFFAVCPVYYTAGQIGLIFRYYDSSNYGYCCWNGTNVQLHKVVAGVDTTLIDVASTYAAGRSFYIICHGTLWRMAWAGTLRGTDQTVSDANLQSGTGVGFYTTNPEGTVGTSVLQCQPQCKHVHGSRCTGDPCQ